jgi:hypothetical protein
MQARMAGNLTHRRHAKSWTVLVGNRMAATPRGWAATWNVLFLLTFFKSIGLFNNALWFPGLETGAAIFYKTDETLR